jgi:hypothetical protein
LIVGTLIASVGLLRVTAVLLATSGADEDQDCARCRGHRFPSNKITHKRQALACRTWEERRRFYVGLKEISAGK